MSKAATGYDYVAIGHVTVDRERGKEDRVGGTAAYSALQAARLGLRALIVTRGQEPLIERLLEPFASELDVWIQNDAQTTTLITRGSGAARSQRVASWAGEIEPVRLPDAAILHVGPVAQETKRCTEKLQQGFVGLTPQGLVRHWGADGHFKLVKLPLAALPDPCAAIVISDAERQVCDQAMRAATDRGATCAITQGAQSAEVSTSTGSFSVPALSANAVDDQGAGDVFAAAFFASLAEGRSPRAAAAFAQAAAAVRIAAPGVNAIGTRASIAELLAAEDK